MGLELGLGRLLQDALRGDVAAQRVRLLAYALQLRVKGALGQAQAGVMVQVACSTRQAQIEERGVLA